MSDMIDEMVERAAKAVAAFLHAGEFQSPDQNWAQMSKHQKAQARALVQTVTAALAVQPGGVDVKPLDWQTTYVDRGDGQKEESGWEADNGFNQWYSVEMYFGTDSYGWQVKFDCDVIADHDDPERAKAAAQEHFASRILSRLTPSIGAEGWRPIESAPKDRLIDLWLGDRRWSDCYFDAICREWRTTANSGHLAWAPERAATHWMERPAPPAAQEGSNG